MRGLFIALLASVVLAACARGPSAGPSIPAVPSGAARTHPAVRTVPSNPITHIVFIVQENRTFDNIFGGPNPFPGADAVATGKTLNGSIPLNGIPLGGGDDPNNYHQEWLWACNAPSPPPFPVGNPSPCQMNGFNVAASPSPVPSYSPPAPVSTIYSYVNYEDTEPYWDMASKYALGDHFFMGHNSESYTAHQYIFSAQSNNTVDAPIYPDQTNYCGFKALKCVYTPWGCDSPAGTTVNTLNSSGVESSGGPFPCFGPGTPMPGVTYPSLANLVAAKGLTWRLYTHSLCANINGLDVNGSVRYTSIWPTVVNMSGCHSTWRSIFPTPVNTAHFRVPEKTILQDVAGPSGTLANVTWVLPGPFSSDHPGVPLGSCGPNWVARVVNAIGTSKYWNSTAIFIFWDDWGGFYDHVPPYVVRDQAGPGFRVPLLVISPYSEHGVIHTNAEFATLINFAEQTLGLGTLGATDASPYLNEETFTDQFFDFGSAKPFVKIKYPVSLCNYYAEPKPGVKTNSRWLKMVDDD